MATVVAGSRVDQYRSTIIWTMPDGSILQPWSLPGFNEWDTIAGGGVTAPDTKYQPAGGRAMIALGGVNTTANLTLTRIYDFIRDHNNIGVLLSAVGLATATVTKIPLDRGWNSTYSTLVYTGLLIDATPPDGDSTSAGAAGMLSVQISVGSLPSQG